jgi:GTP-binding protein HflX
LRGELEKVRAHRGRHRARRQNSQIPTVALVGYTNAGKSTLLNRLSTSNVYVADQLFATLDPTTRKIELPGGRGILVTDTVGFIQKLPTTLVAAFQATLEEIAEADLLLHVVDATHPNAQEQSQAVEETLEEIGAAEPPVVMALNKIDAINGVPPMAFHGVPISALTGEGLPELLAAIQHELYEVMEPLQVTLPYREGRLINLFHEHGVVERIEHIDGVVKMTGRIPRRLLWAFDPFREDTKERTVG